MLEDKHVRIIALSDVSHELSNQEVDLGIKLIRVLTHEIDQYHHAGYFVEPRLRLPGLQRIKT